MLAPRASLAALALGVALLVSLTASVAGPAAPLHLAQQAMLPASAPLAASAPAAARQAPLPASAPPAALPASAPIAASAPLAVVPASAPAPASAPPQPLPPSARIPASAPAAAPPGTGATERPIWVPNIPPIPALNVLDEPRNYVSREFVSLVSSIDRFFGTDSNYQEANDSVVQLDLTRVMGYTGVPQFVLQGRASVHLPNTEKRLHLLLESDPDTNTANATRQLEVNQPVATTQAPSSFGAGVRLERQGADERWHLATDGGLKFAGLNTAPFARVRGSYALPLDDWRMKATETVFWFNTTGAGQTTEVDFERTISDPLLFRASSNDTWLNTTQQMDLRQDLILFQKVDDRTAMQYQASVIGLSDAHMQSHVVDYVVLALYRHRLHRQWMYLELSPQLHFPQERGYMSNATFIVRLEMLFDKSE